MTYLARELQTGSSLCWVEDQCPAWGVKNSTAVPSSTGVRSARIFLWSQTVSPKHQEVGNAALDLALKYLTWGQRGYNLIYLISFLIKRLSIFAFIVAIWLPFCIPPRPPHLGMHSLLIEMLLDGDPRSQRLPVSFHPQDESSVSSHSIFLPFSGIGFRYILSRNPADSVYLACM